MNAVFADTFYWIALTNPADSHLHDARRFDDLLSGGSVCTREEVLAEVLTFFAWDSWLRLRAVETVREILADPAIQILPQSHESFLSGFDLYAARPDNGYSLTDCISMQAMRKQEITDALTNDLHFEQEGFRALFGIRESGRRGRPAQCAERTMLGSGSLCGAAKLRTGMFREHLGERARQIGPGALPRTELFPASQAESPVAREE